MQESTEHYELLQSRIEQAISFLIALYKEEHVAAISAKDVAMCANAAQALIYEAGEEATQLWKCFQPAESEGPCAIGNISDTYENVYARVDQAHSILNSVLANDHFVVMDGRDLAGTLSASQELMEQSRQGMEKLWELIKHHSVAEALAKQAGEAAWPLKPKSLIH